MVVRGGILRDLDRVVRSAQHEYDTGYGSEEGLGLGLSVMVGEQQADESWSDFLCRMATDGEIRHNQVRVALFDAIEALGLAIVPTPPPPGHHDVDLGTINPGDKLEQLVTVFREAEANPCPYQD